MNGKMLEQEKGTLQGGTEGEDRVSLQVNPLPLFRQKACKGRHRRQGPSQRKIKSIKGRESKQELAITVQ